MPVSIVGTPVTIGDGGSYTAETGTNRVVLAVMPFEETNSVTVAPTLGGVAFTEGYFIEASGREYVYYGFIKEASIPAGSNTLAVNPSLALDDLTCTLYTLEGADIDSANIGTGYNTNVAATDHTVSFTGVADGMDFATACAQSTATTFVAVGGWTTRILNTGTASTFHTADKASAAGASTWGLTTTASATVLSSVFVVNPSSPSLSVTQTDTTPEDGVQQTLTTSGLTGTPTGTLAGKALTLSGTLPNLTYTLDVSAVEASEGMPRIGETSTVAITGNEGTATTDVVIQPKTGWARTVLAGTLDKSANGFLATLDAQLGVTSAVGDIIYFDASSNAAITATGVYTSDLTSAGQKTDFVIQQGGSATTTATSEGGSFYPYGESGSGNQIRTKFRRFPWQTHYKL